MVEGGTYLGLGGKGTYLRQGEGTPTLDGGRGYLPWTGYAAGGTPLAASRRGTFVLRAENTHRK